MFMAHLLDVNGFAEFNIMCNFLWHFYKVDQTFHHYDN